MALLCVSSTSVTNPKCVLPVLAETSVSTLSNTLPSTTSLKKLLPPNFNYFLQTFEE
jgi:hypothetical protein